MTLEQTIAAIEPLDEKAMEQAWQHWDSIAKPLRSLGKTGGDHRADCRDHRNPEFL